MHTTIPQHPQLTHFILFTTILSLHHIKYPLLSLSWIPMQTCHHVCPYFILIINRLSHLISLCIHPNVHNHTRHHSFLNAHSLISPITLATHLIFMYVPLQYSISYLLPRSMHGPQTSSKAFIKVSNSPIHVHGNHANLWPSFKDLSTLCHAPSIPIFTIL